MTLRQAAGRARHLLLDHPCKVRGRSVSFAGFGYGSAGFVHVECETPLPPHAMADLENLDREIKEQGKSKIIILLEGTAYPFASTVGKK
jgi:hypothetical protein